MTTNPISRIAERASESLYEDERLRSNLTDAQAVIVLKWAEEWLTRRINSAHDEATAQQVAQTEGKRVRAAVAAINALGQDKDMTLAQAVVTLEPVLTAGKPFSRDELLTLLTSLVSPAWNMR
ncbi:MAG: hypothetical protein WCF84_16660 [Anaerolineae bacterium]